MLSRAQFDAATVAGLIKDLSDIERIELMRSFGHIQPRTRFKRSGSHPLQAGSPINSLSIDECGKSFPEARGPQFFTLAGIAINAEDVDGYREAADALKEEYFQKSMISFHEPDMRNHEGPFYFGGDLERQKQFDDAIDELVWKTPFVAFAVGVRKAALAQHFQENGLTVLWLRIGCSG